jgi:hypothetical protein
MENSSTLIANRQFLLRLLGKNGSAYQSLPTDFFEQFDFVMQQIRTYFKFETSQRRDDLLPRLTQLAEEVKAQPPGFSELSSYLEETRFHLMSTDYQLPLERDAWLKQELSEAALSIPTMVEEETLKYYRWLAGRTSRGGEIIELGCWLGATAYCLAEGLSAGQGATGRHLHAFDSFRWERWMNPFLSPELRRQLNVKEGESYLSAFLSYCSEFSHLIKPREGYLYLKNAKGKLPPFAWDGARIKMYVYDLSGEYAYVKKAWDIFSHAFIPGETIIIFDEYGNLQADGLRRFCREKSSQLLPLHKPAASTKAFLYQASVER